MQSLGFRTLLSLRLWGFPPSTCVIWAGYSIRLRVDGYEGRNQQEVPRTVRQMACEAVAAIRTVASLTREKECCDIYCRNLEIPLRLSTRSSIFSSLAFAISQSTGFFAIALMFWYGSRLVADGQYNINEFFICLTSVTFRSNPGWEVS